MNYKAVVLVPTDSLKGQDSGAIKVTKSVHFIKLYEPKEKNNTFFSLWTIALIEDKLARSSDSYTYGNLDFLQFYTFPIPINTI